MRHRIYHLSMDYWEDDPTIFVVMVASVFIGMLLGAVTGSGWWLLLWAIVPVLGLGLLTHETTGLGGTAKEMLSLYNNLTPDVKKKVNLPKGFFRKEFAEMDGTQRANFINKMSALESENTIRVNRQVSHNPKVTSLLDRLDAAAQAERENAEALLEGQRKMKELM
jgi:hypothetical protein